MKSYIYSKSHNDYEDELRKLDPQPGECFAMHDNNYQLKRIILVLHKDEENAVNKLQYASKCINICQRSFTRTNIWFNADNFITYNYIIQVDRTYFDKLDKAIGMVNAQLNAYQGMFTGLIKKEKKKI